MSGGALSAGTVSLGVKGDAKGFGAKVAADVKGQGSIFSDLGKHVGGLIVGGLGLAGIGLSIGAVFKTGFEEAKADEAITAQFAAGIKSTGNAANLTVKDMEGLAESIASYSGQSDESIGKTEQLLQTFTNIRNVGPNKIFDQATVAATDMAAKMGGDASSNAIRLGRALNDPAKGVAALTRVGVQFTQAQKDQIAAMVKAGDTMGAQKVILKELSTEFGGAAKAAGETMPGMLARGKVAFEQLSKGVVETLVPLVMPAISGVVDLLRRAAPVAEEFAKTVADNLGGAFRAVSPFLTMAVDTVKLFIGSFTGQGADVGNLPWMNQIVDAGAGVRAVFDTATSAFRDLIQGFKDGEGPGGAIRDVVNGVWSVAKLLGDTLVSLDLPGKFRAIVQQWQDGTGAGGLLKDAVKVLLDGLSGLGGFLSGTLVPGIKDVVSWMGQNKQAVIDIASVIGVVLLPVFADLAVKEAISTATSVANWITKATTASTSAATEFAAHYTVVAGWVASAGAAIASGATTVAIWALYAAEAVAGAAKTVGSLLVVAGGWISTAATATVSGITMAAAWVIGLGPVAWIIAAVVAVGAAFVVLYNKVGWFRDGVNAAWNGIKAGFAAVKDWLIGAWNNTVDFFTGLPAKIGSAFKAVAGFITAPFRLEFNGIAALWNKTIGGWHIDIPSWVPGLGGKGFTMPQIPTLAQGATVMPTPGGTVVRVAEAGRAESIVDTGKLNNLLDKAGNGVSVTNNIYEAVSAEATANQVTRRLVARFV